MALEARLYQRLSQQLVMTPQLRQAIKILQVSRLELEQLVDQELVENPVLEEGVEQRDEEEEEKKPRTEERLEPKGEGGDDLAEARDESQTTTEIEPEKPLNDIDWKEYLDTYNNDWHGSSATSADYEDERRPSLENTLVRSESLAEHLMWQLRMNQLDEAEQAVTVLLIGNMDEDGYLHLPIEDVAFASGRDYDVVERALRRIQELDPPGVGARDLRECLLLQFGSMGQSDSLAATLVRDHLELLSEKRYDRIAKELGVATEDVVAAAKAIGVLEPKPGRNFGDGGARYIIPDVFVYKVGGEYVVNLNDDGLPRLRVSSYYRKVLRAQEGGEAKRYIQEKMRSAAWLIKSIQQRQRTLFLVTSSIVKFQRDFLDEGIARLKPLVLRDVAMDIGMHESTVSRATANKYVHTPQGTLELKFFFTSGLRGADGDEVSAESVKERIRTIIGGENPRRPFSDQWVAQLLAKENITIARRTVAKYREFLGILPSSKRRQVY